MITMGPDFICIGAQKAGTTWLATQLRSHPEIWITPNKELHYFDWQSHYSSSAAIRFDLVKCRLENTGWSEKAKKRIVSSIDSGHPALVRWWSRYLFSNYSDEWYLSLFKDAGSKISGELTPAYSALSAQQIDQMANLLPNVKIIFLIRNPIDRAWSWLRFSEKRGEAVNLADTKSLIDRIDSDGQVLRSDYMRTLQLYQNSFSPDNILLCFYDAIVQQPSNLMKQILSFLEVDDCSTQRFDLNKISNASPKRSIPHGVCEYLISKYKHPILDLANTYGSYCKLWANELNIPNQHFSLEENPMPAFKLSDMLVSSIGTK